MPAVDAVDPHPGEVADVAEVEHRRAVRRSASSTSVAYVPTPANPAGCRPEVGPRTRPVRQLRLQHARQGQPPRAVQGDLLPRRPLPRRPDRRAATNTDPSGGRSIRPVAVPTVPAEGHRVPGDEALGPRRSPSPASGNGLARKVTSSPVDPPADPQHLGAVDDERRTQPQPSSAAPRSSVSTTAAAPEPVAEARVLGVVVRQRRRADRTPADHRRARRPRARRAGAAPARSSASCCRRGTAPGSGSSPAARLAVDHA